MSSVAILPPLFIPANFLLSISILSIFFFMFLFHVFFHVFILQNSWVVPGLQISWLSTR